MPKISTVSGAYNAHEPGYFEETVNLDNPIESTNDIKPVESTDDIKSSKLQNQPVADSTLRIECDAVVTKGVAR